jgi:hypothetical protein
MVSDGRWNGFEKTSVIFVKNFAYLNNTQSGHLSCGSLPSKSIRLKADRLTTESRFTKKFLPTDCQNFQIDYSVS